MKTMTPLLRLFEDDLCNDGTVMGWMKILSLHFPVFEIIFIKR